MHRTIENQAKYITDALQVTTTEPSYKSEYQVHHIVAENHSSAQPTRDIFVKSDVDITVNDYRNLVPLKSFVHQHLHTQVYFAQVNTIIMNAYYLASSNRLGHVSGALSYIRTFLQNISNASPF